MRFTIERWGRALAAAAELVDAKGRVGADQLAALAEAVGDPAPVIVPELLAPPPPPEEPVVTVVSVKPARKR